MFSPGQTLFTMQEPSNRLHIQCSAMPVALKLINYREEAHKQLILIVRHLAVGCTCAGAASFLIIPLSAAIIELPRQWS